MPHGVRQLLTIWPAEFGDLEFVFLVDVCQFGTTSSNLVAIFGGEHIFPRPYDQHAGVRRPREGRPACRCRPTVEVAAAVQREWLAVLVQQQQLPGQPGYVALAQYQSNVERPQGMHAQRSKEISAQDTAEAALVLDIDLCKGVNGFLETNRCIGFLGPRRTHTVAVLVAAEAVQQPHVPFLDTAGCYGKLDQ